MRRRAVWLVMWMVGVGCASTSGTGVKGGARVEPSEELVVKDVGAEPRFLARFALQPESVFQSTQTMSMDMGVEVHGERKLQSTVVVLKKEERVLGVDESGRADVEFRFLEASVQGPKGAPKGEHPLARLVGQSLRGEVYPNGRRVLGETGKEFWEALVGGENKAVLGEQLRGHLNKSMESFEMRMPDQPVGVGARWETREVLDMAGVQANVTSTYKVVSISEAGAALDVEVSMGAHPGKIVLPGVPPEAAAAMQISLKRFEGGGGGRLLLEWGSPTYRGDTAMEAGFVMHVDRASNPEKSFDLEMEMEMRIETK